MKHSIQRRLILYLALFIAVLLAGVHPAAAHTPDTTCQPHTLEVTLSPADPTTYTLYGELCWSGAAPGDTVQLLVHGGTYNHTYWDWQYYQPQHYSYVDHAVHRGYATFNIDRLGAGSSDIPNGLINGVDANAYTLHQVVQALRGGTFGTSFGTVILVGHSFGSMISIAEASQYQDVDAVVLTGFAHNLSPDALAAAPTALMPASEPFYFTTVPGAREVVFFNAAFTDPNILTLDEQHKDILSAALLNELARFFSPESLGINVPVYLLIGDSDFLFCGGALDCSDPDNLAAYEANFFSPAACLQTDLIPQSGHNLNLHRNAGQTFASILSWIDHLSDACS